MAPHHALPAGRGDIPRSLSSSYCFCFSPGNFYCVVIIYGIDIGFSEIPWPRYFPMAIIFATSTPDLTTTTSGRQRSAYYIGTLMKKQQSRYYYMYKYWTRPKRLPSVYTSQRCGARSFRVPNYRRRSSKIPTTYIILYCCIGNSFIREPPPCVCTLWTLQVWKRTRQTYPAPVTHRVICGINILRDGMFFAVILLSNSWSTCLYRPISRYKI